MLQITEHIQIIYANLLFSIRYSVTITDLCKLKSNHNRIPRTRKVRDAESMSGTKDIEDAFDVKSDGQRKHTKEERLLLCVLCIDSW